MTTVNLDQILSTIDQAFGAQLPFLQRELLPEELTALDGVFGDEGFQRFLQDEVNRQIIRDYLVNAVRLELISSRGLDECLQQSGSEDERSLLSLHMLMCSVEEAEDVARHTRLSKLQALKLQEKSPTPTHIEIVRT
jgi:hypothetical protein